MNFTCGLSLLRQKHWQHKETDMDQPKENEPVDVYFVSKHGEGWMLAYWGTAFSSSEPHEPHSQKLCWRYCNTQDELNCNVLRWKLLTPTAQ